MVDRGIEVILNSTIWTKNSHSGAYDSMKERLGLDPNDPQDIGMIINTSMSPWLRAQRTYKRLGVIIRNELYNAHGAVYDEPTFLNFVSPSLVGMDTNGGDVHWDGYAFVELEVKMEINLTKIELLPILPAGLILKPELTVSRDRPDCLSQEGFKKDKRSGQKSF